VSSEPDDKIPHKESAMRLTTVAIALFLVNGSLLAQAEKKPPADRWRAWAVTEGKETKLVVEGVYGNGGPVKVALVEAVVPQGINPKILMLELKTASLPGIWPAVVQPIPAYYVKGPYTKDTHTSVTVKYPDGSVVTIAAITDAEAGPKVK
jgi:hypothetical protein